MQDTVDRPVWKYADLDRNPPGQLSFDVLYQLQVCISQGIFDEHTFEPAFGRKLSSMRPSAARGLLEFVAGQKNRIFDPMSIFDLLSSVPAFSGAIPSYCALVRSVIVTPTTLRFNTPTVETSNRILRQYPRFADRFIRVRFTEERSGVSHLAITGKQTKP